MSAVPPLPSPADASPARGRGQLAALVVVLAAVAAYVNTVSAPFVFDDKLAIVDNPSIRDLSAWHTVLNPPPGSAGAFGRPVVNFTLALNYAIGGLDPRGYHLVNILIHALAALTLFGLVSRTLVRCGLRWPQHGSAPGRAGPARLLAGIIATLWAVHPLLTETVTCVVQRNESLASLFLLLTLYAFVRAVEVTRDQRRATWSGIAIAATLLGMATKETMVVAPVLVLLYDRTFVGATFGGALRQRWPLHLALAAGWLLLGALVVSHHDRNATVGLGHGVTVLDYALTQCWAVPHYLALSFWPAPLVLDYGRMVVTTVRTIGAPAAVLTGLIVATVVMVARRPKVGFAAASFLILLAPSSSVFPLVTQTVAEHRMYLPLAPVLTLGVLAAYFALGSRHVVMLVTVALPLLVMTWARNGIYRSELALWIDTVAKAPANARAHFNLGNALRRAGRDGPALSELRQAVTLAPLDAPYHAGYANALAATGRLTEAVAEYDTAVRLAPDSAEVWHNRGTALLRTGRPAEAIESYRAAIRLDSTVVETHRGLGDALAQRQRFAEAASEYESALRLAPDSAVLHGSLANALFSLGATDAARAHYETALRLDPADADAHNNFGALLLALDEPGLAAKEFATALRLRPDFPAARANLEKVQSAGSSLKGR